MIGGMDEPQLADEMELVTAQVRERLEDELREAGRKLMRELDRQIDRIDDLLWELRDEESGLDYRVLRDARRAAHDMRDQAGYLPDRLESLVQWWMFDRVHALAVDVRHGLG